MPLLSVVLKIEKYKYTYILTYILWFKKVYYIQVYSLARWTYGAYHCMDLITVLSVANNT